MRSYVPATHERDGVAPRSRSCAPGLTVLSVEVLNVVRILDVMNVYRGPRRRWMVILS